MDFAKASQTFNIPKSTLWGGALGLSKWSAHGNILLTELFAATNNDVKIILWQVSFVIGRLNCNSIYLTPPGLVRGTVCVYPFVYESWNEIIKYTKYVFIDIYVWKYRCVWICRQRGGYVMRVQISSQHKHKLFSRHQKSPVNHTKTYNSITSGLVILYKYLFVHNFVHLAHGFIHILTKLYCLGRTFTLSLVFKLQCSPREIVTLSSDSIAYCKSSNKSLLNSK